MIILLDQDGVLADFEEGFRRVWHARMGHEFPALLPTARKSFYIDDDYPAHHTPTVEQIMTAQGFYRDLPVIPGALEAIRALQALGHQIAICTSPHSANRFCVQEKLEWVEEHLGSDFVRKVIIAKDKTLVHGDVLIDDRPEVTGICQPTWQHVLYDQPYNRLSTAPRLTWNNWQTVLLDLPPGNPPALAQRR